MEVKNEQTWAEWMEKANDDYEVFLLFAGNMSNSFLLLIQLGLDVLGVASALCFFAYVEHHRYMVGAETFMGSRYSSILAIALVLSLILIPAKEVQERKRNGLLQKEIENKEEETYVSGISLVKFFRWLRFFLGLWGERKLNKEGKPHSIQWEKLEIRKNKRLSKLKKLEYMLISVGTSLATISSFLIIEGLVVPEDTNSWYVGLLLTISETNMHIFFPVFLVVVVTFTVALAVTTLSTELFVSIAMIGVERNVAKVERVEKKRSQSIVTVFNASVKDKRRNGFWTNLQNIEGILMNEDKVSTASDRLNFWDSKTKTWLSDKPFATTTALRQAISKRITKRQE